MNQAVLPPSPNWYLSSVLACSNDGTIAWGARNMIVIGRRTADSKILKYSIVRNVHVDRVSSLSFSPEFGQDGKNLLASGGDEHIVRIWNLDDLSAIKSYSYADVKQTVAAVDWSKKDPNIVCCISSEGTLVSWNILFNIATPISIGKLTATCLACCPHNADLLAVGSKTGLVYIVNTHSAKSVLYKLRGHDSEIVSLSWCPVDTNIFKDENSKDLLLASGGKDKSVFIWRAGSDGRYETEIIVPSNPLDSHQHKTKLNATVGSWITVNWLEPSLLLASSLWGELISWNLSKLTKNKPVCKLIHARHSRGLFCITGVSHMLTDAAENWRVKTRSTIWTLAQDRRVVCCNVHDDNVELEYDIPTQGGYVYCLAACPLDTSRIAFGVGDAMLRLWNLSEPHEAIFDVNVFWQKIKGKIRAISWHPEKENLIAYATGEGRIGVFDTNGNKPPNLFRQYHRNTVYGLGWGPNPQNDHYAIYSCAEGELVYYDFEKPKQEPINILKKECTEFSWKSDFSCLAVGLENGSIVYFNKRLEKCGYSMPSVVPLKKAINCLAWHPESTVTDLALSPLQNYLAVASDTSTITVFDVADLVKNINDSKIDATANASNATNEENTDICNTYKMVATLNGHSESVVCLAWSPHFSGHLISGSYDHTAQVWKVETQELVATYLEHCGPVLSCLWSPLNPDLILTGSADFSVRIWKISEQKPIMPTEKPYSTKSQAKKKNKKKLRNKQKNKVNKGDVNDTNDQFELLTDKNENIPDTVIEKTADETVVSKMETVAPEKVTTKKQNQKSFILNCIRDIIKTKSDKEEKSGAMLEHGKQVKVKSEQNDKEVEEDRKENDSLDETSFFEKEYLFTSIISSPKQIGQGKRKLTTQLDLWNHKLKQNLEEAMKQKCLNDFLVSLAPSLSMKTWIEVCEAYAAQLVHEGDALKAASYLLCIHKILPAVNVLLDAKLYKEAYCLAQCRLSPDESIYRTILQQWAEYDSQTGNFEQAALCYTKLGQYVQAATLLARRNNIDCFECAIELASVSNEDFPKSVTIDNYAEQAITLALLNADYTAAQRIISNVPRVKHYEVPIHVSKEIRNIFEAENKQERVRNWLGGDSNYGILRILKDMYADNDSYYAKLERNNYSVTPENEAMLWVNVSYQIAMAVTCNTEEKCISHVVAALGSISDFETFHRKVVERSGHFLIHILTSLDDKNPFDEESIYSKTTYPATKSLRAYLCLGLLNWSTKIVETENLTNKTIELIENLLEDVLDRDTAKFCTLINDINKLETELASVLGKIQIADESEDAKKDTTSLLEKLAELKKEKEDFVEHRISAPTPIVAYSKASELGSKISDESVKGKFMNVLSEKWFALICNS